MKDADKNSPSLEPIEGIPGLGPNPPVLIAQNDDPELLEWLSMADQYGGGFVRSMARAALVADDSNYPLIRPLILQLRVKYPKYEPSEAVKQEIEERKA